MRAIVYRWLTAVWPTTIVGLLFGAILGGLAAQALSGDPPSATALVRIDQPIDPNQIITNNYASTELQQTFLAGEIVYLSSTSLANSVGAELNLRTPPGLEAEQQGLSTSVRLTTTGATTEEAAAALDAAIKIYAGRAQELARERTQAAIDANTSVIVRVRAETASNAAQNRINVDKLALEEKLKSLEQQRLSLQSQLLRPPAIQLIEPIAAEPQTSDPLLPIVGGSLLGGLMALAGTLAWRGRSGVIVSVQQLDCLVSPVLLPVVPLGARGATRGPDDVDRARTLFGQLPAPRVGEVLVLGASRHSGTDVVAQCLLDGAMERVSATAVNLVDECADLSSEELGTKLDSLQAGEGQTVIVDGGSIASAPQALDMAERANQIVVVAQIGRDVTADVETLQRAIGDSEVSISAICTKGGLVAWR